MTLKALHVKILKTHLSAKFFDNVN